MYSSITSGPSGNDKGSIVSDPGKPPAKDKDSRRATKDLMKKNSQRQTKEFASDSRRQTLEQRMRGSIVDNKTDLTMVSGQITEYRRLYTALGAYAIVTSLVDYPLQQWLWANGMDKDTVEAVRLLFYLPWMFKLFMAVLGDVVFLFRYKIRGWVYILGTTNATVALLAVIFSLGVWPMIIVVVLLITNMAFLDTIAQGTTAMVVELERRKFSLQNPGSKVRNKLDEGEFVIYAETEEPSDSNKSKPVKDYIPTYAFNYGIYTCVTTFFRGIYTTFAYASFTDNQFIPILGGIGIMSIAVISLAFWTEELQQTGWIRSKKSQKEGWKSFKMALKAITGQGRWIPNGLLMIVLTIMSLNPINYLNETMVKTVLDKNGTRHYPGQRLMTEDQISIGTAVAGGMATILFFIILRSFKLIGLGFYLMVPTLFLYINSGMAFYFDKEYKFDSMYALYTYITYSHFVQSVVCSFCRLCVVDLFMRPIPGDSFQLILVSLLTTMANLGQAGSKWLQSRQYTEDKVDGDCFRAGVEGIAWTSGGAILALAVYVHHKIKSKPAEATTAALQVLAEDPHE